MNLLFWGLTIGTVGKVLLAIGVIIAHAGIVKEQRIDTEVLRGFRIEHSITILGMVLIVVGYFMEVYFYGFATNLLTCFDTDCEHAAAAILSL
jgi:hypothetical protein